MARGSSGGLLFSEKENKQYFLITCYRNVISNSPLERSEATNKPRTCFSLPSGSCKSILNYQFTSESKCDKKLLLRILKTCDRCVVIAIGLHVGCWKTLFCREHQGHAGRAAEESLLGNSQRSHCECCGFIGWPLMTLDVSDSVVRAHCRRIDLSRTVSIQSINIIRMDTVCNRLCIIWWQQCNIMAYARTSAIWWTR